MAAEAFNGYSIESLQLIFPLMFVLNDDTVGGTKELDRARSHCASVVCVCRYLCVCLGRPTDKDMLLCKGKNDNTVCA